MDSFDQMALKLMAESKYKAPEHKIPLADYEAFCREYIFDNLRGVSFGVAFCKKFEVNDLVLLVLKTVDGAKLHISDSRYIV